MGVRPTGLPVSGKKVEKLVVEEPVEGVEVEVRHRAKEEKAAKADAEKSAPADVDAPAESEKEA
ncbi:MAG: hypothetical protein M5R36_16910 [Deltaproteobacteria bacterium]|nr:hypothetical protein [Deltaproteobacteria bacterium]